MELLLQKCFAKFLGENRFKRWFAKRIRDMLFAEEKKDVPRLQFTYKDINPEKRFTMFTLYWRSYASENMVMYYNMVKLIQSIRIKHMKDNTWKIFIRYPRFGDSPEHLHEVYCKMLRMKRFVNK